MTGPPPAPGLPDPHGRRQTDSDLYPPPTLAALPVAQAEVASRGGGLGERVAATTAAFFEAVGVRVGTRPWLTIGLAFLVVLAGASGISQMDMEGRQENLWVPKETQAQWDKVSPRVAVGRRARPRAPVLGGGSSPATDAAAKHHQRRGSRRRGSRKAPALNTSSSRAPAAASSRRRPSTPRWTCTRRWRRSPSRWGARPTRWRTCARSAATPASPTTCWTSSGATRLRGTPRRRSWRSSPRPEAASSRPSRAPRSIWSRCSAASSGRTGRSRPPRPRRCSTCWRTTRSWTRRKGAGWTLPPRPGRSSI